MRGKIRRDKPPLPPQKFWARPSLVLLLPFRAHAALDVTVGQHHGRGTGEG
jgi:hypothetical protein